VTPVVPSRINAHATRPPIQGPGPAALASETGSRARRAATGMGKKSGFRAAVDDVRKHTSVAFTADHGIAEKRRSSAVRLDLPVGVARGPSRAEEGSLGPMIKPSRFPVPHEPVPRGQSGRRGPFRRGPWRGAGPSQYPSWPFSKVATASIRALILGFSPAADRLLSVGKLGQTQHPVLVAGPTAGPGCRSACRYPGGMALRFPFWPGTFLARALPLEIRHSLVRGRRVAKR